MRRFMCICLRSSRAATTGGLSLVLQEVVGRLVARLGGGEHVGPELEGGAAQDGEAETELHQELALVGAVDLGQVSRQVEELTLDQDSVGTPISSMEGRTQPSRAFPRLGTWGSKELEAGRRKDHLGEGPGGEQSLGAPGSRHCSARARCKGGPGEVRGPYEDSSRR